MKKQNRDGTKSSDETEKKRRSSLIKLGSVMVLAFIVWVFSTIAWFSMNKSVSGGGMGINVDTGPFVLAARGDNTGAISYTKSGGVYTSEPLYEMTGAVGAGDGASYTYSGVTYYTARGADIIKWRLTDNYDPADEGIGPDSSGTLTFYLIPSTDSGFTAHISLNMEGYKADVRINNDENDAQHNGSYAVSNLTRITSTDSEYAACEYLNRRILFFSGGSKGTYTGFIDKDGFDLTFADNEVTMGVPIEVTLRWIWPKTFAQMACISENTADNITNDTTARAAIRAYIVAEPQNLLNRATISRNEALLKMSDDAGDQTYTFNASKAQTNLIALSEGYNLADSKVGKDVQYMLLSVTAE
ncbi:hypothetical protein [Ruminococcus sp.]|uniref:hypothetical protein n=1 Tax=Ruminococcus sp. TaxID=41978 RepID=UPI0025F28A2E|nr:hypothetical protein [Ruminococcus sp.]